MRKQERSTYVRLKHFSKYCNILGNRRDPCFQCPKHEIGCKFLCMHLEIDYESCNTVHGLLKLL